MSLLARNFLWMHRKLISTASFALLARSSTASALLRTRTIEAGEHQRCTDADLHGYACDEGDELALAGAHPDADMPVFDVTRRSKCPAVANGSSAIVTGCLESNSADQSMNGAE